MNTKELPQVSRRRVLKGAAALGIGALAAIANPQAFFTPSPENPLAKKAEAAPLADGAATETLTSQMRREIETRFTVDDVGYRISNVFTLGDDFDYIAYQGLVFQRVRETGEIRPWNTLDVLHDRGYDNFLDDYSKSGVTIPAHIDMDDKSGGNVEVAFNNRIKAFGVNPKVEAFARALRIKAEIGVPTSPTKNYGSYEVTRFQRVAIQEWVDGPQKGLVQRILTGEALLKTGMVPKEAQLARPDLNFADFSSQPEQPNKTPETPGLPDVDPSVLAKIPKLTNPPDQSISNPANWSFITRVGRWYLNRASRGLVIFGAIAGYEVSNGIILLKIQYDKGDLGKIDTIKFDPGLLNGILFERHIGERGGDYDWLRTSNLQETIAGFQTYTKLGDYVQTYTVLNGHKVANGKNQSILFFR